MIQKIRNIASQLEPAYPKDEALALAWWMAEELSGLSRAQLLCGCKDTTFLANTQAIIERLLHFEPIQYIFGHTLWAGLDLKLSPATLIPRPETAELVEKIANSQQLTANSRVLDIGTGSGCIAIALKKHHPKWDVTGIDISEEAIEVTRENARRNGVDVVFKKRDIFAESLDSIGTFDVIVSNPPYISEREKETMRRNVLDYEPSTALFVPNDDPLRFYRRIAELVNQRPTTNDQRPVFLFFEINEAYPQELSAMLNGLGYTDIIITNDIYGKPRIIQARSAR